MLRQQLIIKMQFLQPSWTVIFSTPASNQMNWTEVNREATDVIKTERKSNITQKMYYGIIVNTLNFS